MEILNSQKRIAVISGGTGYVGFEVARKLADDGMSVAILYHIKTKEEVDQMVKTLKGEGHNAYRCNLEDADNVKQVLEQIEKEMGNIYACIHTAGVIPKPKQLHLSSVKDLQEQFEVNVFGSFNFLIACANLLEEHKQGVIVGITTANVVTQNNTKARGAYSVVKFALQGILVALKEELKSFNIRVYSVAPGVMEGGMNSETPKAFIEIVRHSSPTKTLTSSVDVACKISYLCSDDASDTYELTFLLAPETQVI